MEANGSDKPLPPRPYLEIIESIIRDSFDETQAALDANKISHKVSTYAHAVLVNSIIVANARVAFDGDKNVSIAVNGHGATFLFRNLPDTNEDFDIRFKKCNEKFQTYNSRTARNSRFMGQGSLFDGMPEAPVNFHVNLNAVYKRDVAGTKIETWITYPVGTRSIAWKIQLFNGQNDQTLDATEPTSPPPATKPIVKRVIPIEQNAPEQKQANDGSSKS
ncbi:MAG: hypothetical protein WBW71_04780 [Bacteroidota bacterium]